MSESSAVTDHLLIACDGGSRGNPGPAAIGAVVRDAQTGELLASVSEHIGVATNNVAEYQALVSALETAAKLGATRVTIQADSQLVIRQLEGSYRVRQPHLKPLFDRVRALLAPYDDVELRHVPREENAEADALVNAALDAS